MGPAHIAEMPGLPADPGDRFLSLWVTEHEAVIRRLFPQSTTGARVGEAGAYEIQIRHILAQIHGQTGLVFTAPRRGHIGPCEPEPPFPYRIVPDLPLLPLGAVTAHRNHASLCPGGLQQFIQHDLGAAVKQNVRMPAVHRRQFFGLRRPEKRVLPVDQQKRPGGRPRRSRFHAPTANSIARSRSAPNSRPMPCIMLG